MGDPSIAYEGDASKFEVIISAGDVEVGATDTIKLWMSTYLAEVELQNGIVKGTLPRPRSYHTTPEFDHELGKQFPAIIVVSPGLTGEPMMSGEGYYRATWMLGIGAIVSAADRESTGNLAKLYGAAIRALILQQGRLGGISIGTQWLDESYDDVPAEAGRTLAGAVVVFSVEVEQVVNRRAGPYTWEAPDPDTLPGTDYYSVNNVTIQINRKSILEDVP